ncbi:hypothetical protein NPIL_697441 [Nephila pilipes]|uniref:Uncharacterized protein n=1 Tax=Nephila pilipes TaxID=299642 RepID=A0A8X6QJV9_NEPPI|nr:hypothetical protein NPIL_697441 [Nephila pilipes]
MARTKQSQALAGDSGSTASCAIGDSTASEMPSLEMEISIETPNQTPPLDDNIKKCQSVQYYIEAYTETIQKITEIEAIIKKTKQSLLPTTPILIWTTGSRPPQRRNGPMDGRAKEN